MTGTELFLNAKLKAAEKDCKTPVKIYSKKSNHLNSSSSKDSIERVNKEHSPETMSGSQNLRRPSVLNQLMR